MKKLFLSFIAILVFLTLFSCENKNQESEILNQTINKNNLMEIVANLQKENALDAREILLFSNGLGRLTNLKNDTVFGMTVKQVIDIQNEFIRTNNYNTLRETAARVTMNLNYDMKFLGINKVIDTVNKIEGIAIVYEIHNTSGKGIKKLSGLMQFYNRNNEIIKQFPVTIPQELAVDAKLQFYNAYKYNPKDIRDSLVKNHYNEMIIRWQPQILEFSDGTQINIQ